VRRPGGASIFLVQSFYLPQTIFSTTFNMFLRL
jgi:hypothetical protein